PPPPSPPVPLQDAAEQRRIDDAIAKGVWYLRDHALPEGSWGDALPDGQAPVTLGFASLPALTLLECDVPADEPVIQKAAALVRRQAPAPHDVYDTYQRALAVLFLDRLGDKQDQGLIQYLSLCLAAGQHPTDGAWSYSCPALDRKKVPQLLKQLQAAQSIADWRKAALAGTPLPPDWDQAAAVPKDWDNSNTQFALLALWVARRHRVPIERSIALAEDHFRGTQLGHQDDPEGNNLDMDGSWYYARSGETGWHNSSRWPSMTCAGLLGLAEAQALHQGTKAKPLDDPAIQRGLAMLAREIGRPGEARPTDLYFLWSLERVGVLFRLPQIGGKDWYAWGCQALLPNQGDDGAWKDGVYYDNTPVLNTCFALLFLKQANLAEDLTSKLRLLGGEK
ncbi:MAG TPA: hypothetical protein VJ739_11290, partial [Gemmataceae bacterium]|nr:hypothetical protein [Gemmataceae bacterium]